MLRRRVDDAVVRRVEVEDSSVDAGQGVDVEVVARRAGAIELDRDVLRRALLVDGQDL